MFLLYALVKLNGFLPGWFRRLLKLGSRTEARLTEDDEDDLAADSMSNIQHEYDPLAKLRVEESIRTKAGIFTSVASESVITSRYWVLELEQKEFKQFSQRLLYLDRYDETFHVVELLN
uniref:Uncharacterized protein n=1 Tax=Daphnia galeata TaxID=27404 RepID=A0A8J2RKU4_9CRUS|nr:unnamed protein product [Daphnia galeata]